MFSPSQADVRRFFCSVYAKSRADQPLQAIETIAAMWIDEHPQYHTELADLDACLANMQAGLSEAENAFLHLSMHLSITEQCSIDQPRGIRQAVELLARRKDSLHEAHHDAMECLGQMIWDAQQKKQAPDGQTYVERVQRLATQD
jgi:hypothetical protein